MFAHVRVSLCIWRCRSDVANVQVLHVSVAQELQTGQNVVEVSTLCEMTKVCGTSPSSQKNRFNQRPLSLKFARFDLPLPSLFGMTPRCFVWHPLSTHRVHHEKPRSPVSVDMTTWRDATFREVNHDKTIDWQ